jgi:hypothetical protein
MAKKAETAVPPRVPLAFGELETLSGAGLSVFLAFHHTGVPGKVSVTPQARIVTLINLAKRSGKPMTTRSGLAIGTTPIHIDQNVKFILIGSNHKGLAYQQDMFPHGKIPVQFFAINHYFTTPLPDVYPCNGGFSSTRSNTKIFNHLFTSCL